MAGNGKSNCGKQKPVSSEAACKAAGKILKKAWGGSGSYATWPKACFLYNNKLYFNKHKTGKANKQGNPVCTGAGGGKKTTKKPANPCAKNNGGCNKLRKCANVKGKPVCGKCPNGYTNLGAKNCKKAPAPKYSYAGTGKNSCASVKKKPITTEAGCKAAAKAMKKTYAGKGSYSTWQKACFMTSNRFYFNVHKAGKTHKSGNPVCAGPAKAAPKYSMAGNGKSNCGKQKPVSSEAACKAAGKILKKAWGGSGSYATWPKACFLYNNKLYFNKHAKGK